MSTDIDFVKFVKNRKHAKPEMEDLYEIDFLGRKKEGISFNDTVRNDVKKPKLAEGESSLTDFLTKNKNKILKNQEKRKKKKKKIKKKIKRIVIMKVMIYLKKKLIIISEEKKIILMKCKKLLMKFKIELE